MNTQNTQNTQNSSSESAAEAHDPAEPRDGRPLGYWLRTVDRLLAERFAEAFEREGLTRGDWRRMNRVDGTVPGERFGGRGACRDGDRLGDRPGRADREARRAEKLRRLAERGWIAEDGGGWGLTDSGREAKERLGAEVRGIRATVADAVTPEDYATTVRSLERIAVALGWDPEQPLRPGRGPGWGHRHPRWRSAGGPRRRGFAE
ncbi:hypothetical protein [Leucobacter sp.]